MTANEIRSYPTAAQSFRLHEIPPSLGLDDCAIFLREIAAQLADLNKLLLYVAGVPGEKP